MPSRSTEWPKLYNQKAPVAPLGIIALEGSKDLAGLIDRHLALQRMLYAKEHPEAITKGFLKDSFLISCDCLRFADGSGKAVLNESVRGMDIFIIADIGNYGCKFKMFGIECPMSPDNHFQDIKRVISAINGRAYRIAVIMPLLYGGRQHKRQARESLDCAVSLQELERLQVENFFTFDAHDPRVQNATPLTGFYNLYPTYQILKAFLEKEQDLTFDKTKMMVVSPDEGGMGRSIYYATVLGLNVGMFYKRRDFTQVVNGKNPIVEHEFLGEEVKGKDILIVDDMIASGESTLDIARELKGRQARRIFIAVTFALFTEGVAAFQKAYDEGIVNRVYATNLTYFHGSPANLPWFVRVDMSNFMAYMVDILNHDESISPLFDQSKKIGDYLKKLQR
jgi:ribose-phosphate pyrophosphokinase